MSRIIATLVYSKRVGSAHRKAVLSYLADMANDYGAVSTCSKQTIANGAECARSTAIKICNAFVDEGILRRTGRTKCATGFIRKYSIDIPTVEDLPNISEYGVSA